MLCPYDRVTPVPLYAAKVFPRHLQERVSLSWPVAHTRLLRPVWAHGLLGVNFDAPGTEGMPCVRAVVVMTECGASVHAGPARLGAVQGYLAHKKHPPP